MMPSQSFISAYSVSKAALTTDYSEREQQQMLYENVLHISSIHKLLMYYACPFNFLKREHSLPLQAPQSFPFGSELTCTPEHSIITTEVQ